ncbi:MAG: competence/damage-inducible protein A [Cocleimonas sp.]|nr:competence/damage-inducible protein A [Cocleimonas sp.]
MKQGLNSIKKITSKTQKIGLILIGDELLNASREDKHMQAVIDMLKKRGMKLSWTHLIGDDKEELIALFRKTMATNDVVFSCGGIGATPDDLTRECAAIASKQAIARHPEAQALIEGVYGEKAYPDRIIMGDFPEKADIIPNPVNKMPGFSLADHHFVPGFPEMAKPMIQWVLDTNYKHLFSSNPDIEVRWDLHEVGESDLMPTMTNLLDSFPGVGLSSLPSGAKQGWLIDFGLKGQRNKVEEAATWFEAQLQSLCVNYDYRGESGQQQRG